MESNFLSISVQDTWYYSPLPKELLRGGNMIDVLYVCEFTLQFFTRKEELKRFQKKYLPNNPRRHPPGNGKKRSKDVNGFISHTTSHRVSSNFNFWICTY